MQSMTGFGTSKGRTERSDIDVTLRSVNGRFFEWKANLPQRLMPLEPQLKRLVQKEFERGTVTLLMSERIRPGDISKAPTINLKRAKHWHSALQEMKKTLKLSGDISLDHMLRGSDLFLEDTSQELTSAEQTQILTTFKKALAHCQTERNREGLAIRDDLHKHTQILLKLTARLQTFRETANQNLKTLFISRLKKLGLEIPLTSKQLNTEVALLIEKSDISEEINRLMTHLQRFAEILDGKDAQGKKLDFYVQELLREVNTVGSKSAIPDMTETVVEMKTVIERLREQVQNIE
ncbi:MAG: YicC family protein [Bdellovibrionales bacterium]|nr:YicC family protein [Bdellovibrionales bacterium]